MIDKDFRLKQKPFAIRLLIKEDMESIRLWRNAQLEILRQEKPLSKEDQENYWEKVIALSLEHVQPEMVLFGFLENDQLIGYGGVTHINWKERKGEISFLLNPVFIKDSQGYRLKFGCFLELIKSVAFDKFKLKQLFTETYDIRPDHIAELESRRFRFEKRVKNTVTNEGIHIDSLIHGCEAYER